MPNTGMLDHVALQTSHPLTSPTWMPAWPNKALGYRATSARPRRHTLNYIVPAHSAQQQQQQQQQASFSRHLAGGVAATATDRQQHAEEAAGSRRRFRPYSAPAELPPYMRQHTATAPRTPFTTRLLSIDDRDEEKSDPASNLWTSASGQRHLKGQNEVRQFHTMQKVTCGAYFTRNTEHKASNFGIPPVDTPRWRSERRHQAHHHQAEVVQ